MVTLVNGSWNDDVADLQDADDMVNQRRLTLAVGVVVRALREGDEDAQGDEEWRVKPRADDGEREAGSQRLPVKRIHRIGLVVFLEHFDLRLNVEVLIRGQVVEAAQ